MAALASSLTPGLVAEIVCRVLARAGVLEDPLTVVVGVSNRHVHLSRADLATLFGLDAFTVYKPVRQPGEFAAAQFVGVSGPRSSFGKVRCMGPCRPASQVELSRTDCIALGIDAPLAQSGHLENAAPIDITGPNGCVHLEHGALVAARHLHCGTAWAAQMGLRDQDLIRIEAPGPRGGVLDNVIVRTKDEWVPEIHLDTDEANALGLTGGARVRLVKD
ncbi:MAG: PduL/EutD family phosphate acyltransferase [Actinomycetia bacterium]|nr:PduL/EutD family phosphate acyltransferase [Actinomycetes bacterium]